MAADEASEHVADSDTGLGERTLEQLQGEVLRLARGYNLRPLAEVFRDARQTRNHAARLTGRTHRPGQLADLHVLAGAACGVLANATFDMGYWDVAARFADSALGYGDLAGHDSLRAWALGMQAFVAHWQGRPEHAATKLGEAFEFAPAGTAAVRLHSIAARVRGQLSDPDGVARAVQAAEEARETDGQDELHDGIGGELGYEPARIQVSAATAHVRLGDGPTAEQHAQRALEMYESLPVADRAYYAEYGARVDLAAARVLRGDLPGARDALIPVFALAPAQRVAGVLGRLDQVHILLAAPIYRDSREARQLADDITDFTTTTPAHPLPEANL